MQTLSNTPSIPELPLYVNVLKHLGWTTQPVQEPVPDVSENDSGYMLVDLTAVFNKDGQQVGGRFIDEQEAWNSVSKWAIRQAIIQDIQNNGHQVQFIYHGGGGVTVTITSKKGSELGYTIDAGTLSTEVDILVNAYQNLFLLARKDRKKYQDLV